MDHKEFGVLYLNKDMINNVKPRNYGGDMIDYVLENTFELKENYEKFEGGTLDAAGIYALGKAIEYVENVGVENIEKHLKELTKYTIEKLKKEIKNIKIYATKNTCGIVTFTIDNIHSHDIISILNLENISVRAGHHCAMPLHRYIDEVSTLRLSFGMYTTKEEIDYAISKILGIGEMFNGNI
jgi:cysteine desulfurase